MIDESTLRGLQDSFNVERKKIQVAANELEILRLQFVNKFPVDRIMDMELDEYVIGKPGRDSYCYWVEYKLKKLGSISGAYAYKFGVYYQDIQQRYDFTHKYGTSLDEAFHDVKETIVTLLSASEDNMQAIIDNKLAGIVKAKLLSLYYPQRYLNIFSENHINGFLNELGIDYVPRENLILRRAKLFDVKNNDKVMRSWTTYEYMQFLYYSFKKDIYTPPGNIKKTPEIPTIDPNDNQPGLPPLEDVTLDLFSARICKQTTNTNYHKTAGTSNTDYQKLQEENTKLGKRGEELVMREEKKRLSAEERQYLADNVDHVSLKDNSAGYDIKSFNADGTERYIEVKATRQKYSKSAQFCITANEIITADEYKEKYFIYIVFKADTIKPECMVVDNPSDQWKHSLYENLAQECGISLMPTVFRASILTKRS